MSTSLEQSQSVLVEWVAAYRVYASNFAGGCSIFVPGYYGYKLVWRPVPIGYCIAAMFRENLISGVNR